MANQLKTLKLRFKITGQLHKKYYYEVLDEDGTILAKRTSGRHYVACYVVRIQHGDNTPIFAAPYFFSRPDLIGRGDSRNFVNYPTAYGIAYLEDINKPA